MGAPGLGGKGLTFAGLFFIWLVAMRGAAAGRLGEGELVEVPGAASQRVRQVCRRVWCACKGAAHVAGICGD